MRGLCLSVTYLHLSHSSGTVRPMRVQAACAGPLGFMWRSLPFQHTLALARVFADQSCVSTYSAHFAAAPTPASPTVYTSVRSCHLELILLASSLAQAVAHALIANAYDRGPCSCCNAASGETNVAACSWV
jgi:hypothetical protein